VSEALVHGQLVLVEVPGQEPIPLLVISIECDLCGSSTLALAMHHARAVSRVITDCLAVVDDPNQEGTPLPFKRPKRPENN
jgi:hypothetical protein